MKSFPRMFTFKFLVLLFLSSATSEFHSANVTNITEISEEINLVDDLLPETTNVTDLRILIIPAMASFLELFDPLAQTLSRIRDVRLQTERFGHCTVILPNGTVFIIAGETYNVVRLATTELFDPNNNKSLGSGPTLSEKRRYPACAVMNGDVFVCGGDDRHQFDLNSCQQLHSGMWKYIADMDERRWGPAMVAVGGYLYVMGGYNGNRLSSVEHYDPETNVWTTVSQMPTKRQHLAATVLNGFIYACGGWNEKQLVVCELYNPQNDTWSTAPSMGVARSRFGLVKMGNKLYAIGGDERKNAKQTVEEYDPERNKWTLFDQKLMYRFSSRKEYTAVVV